MVTRAELIGLAKKASSAKGKEKKQLLTKISQGGVGLQQRGRLNREAKRLSKLVGRVSKTLGEGVSTDELSSAIGQAEKGLSRKQIAQDLRKAGSKKGFFAPTLRAVQKIRNRVAPLSKLRIGA